MPPTASEVTAQSRDGRSFTFRAGASSAVRAGDMVVVDAAHGTKVLGQVVDVSADEGPSGTAATTGTRPCVASVATSTTRRRCAADR